MCSLPGDCVTQSCTALATLAGDCRLACLAVTSSDFILFIHKVRVLWGRSFTLLLKSRQTMAVTTVTIIGLAVCFGFILGPSSDDYLSVLGMFAIGNLCIILSTMQYTSYLFVNNQVEHNVFPSCSVNLYSVVCLCHVHTLLVCETDLYGKNDLFVGLLFALS